MIRYFSDLTEEQLSSVLSLEDVAWFQKGCPIPGQGAQAELWERAKEINRKLNEAVDNGVIVLPDTKVVEAKYSANVISDTINDMVSMADGKIYDSKSQYYSSLKERGLVISEGPMVNSKQTAKLDEKKFDRAFKQALEQHGY